jgi:hypothetical protein
MDADLVLAFVSDVHVGPAALFDGKLRKLTAHALPLLEEVVARLNREVRPDVLVNLGDDIEDEGREVDLERLGAVLEVLSRFEGEPSAPPSPHQKATSVAGPVVVTGALVIGPAPRSRSTQEWSTIVTPFRTSTTARVISSPGALVFETTCRAPPTAPVRP